MSLPGPLVLITEKSASGLSQALSSAGAFPIVEARWVEALAALNSIQPAGVILTESDKVDPQITAAFIQQIKQAQPFVPVIARLGELDPLPFPDALAISADAPVDRLITRLAAALRVRALHATVLRRVDSIAAESSNVPALPTSDPLEDATVLVLGRGRSYPTLSVAAGERVGVIGALSVEAAGKCLAAREIDGIVIGDGFGSRMVEAFLLVLADDPRFRDLAIGVLGEGYMPEKLPNILRGRDPTHLVERLMPFVRLHAYDARLRRMIKSLENKGMLDPETGLLNTSAFGEDLTRAIDEAGDRGDGLSIARFSFNVPLDRRTSLDAARVVSRLMRTVDFACRQDDGSIVTVFTGTDLRAAHVVARRLASVLKHTMLQAERDRSSITPHVTLATLKSTDTLMTLMARISPREVAVG